MKHFFLFLLLAFLPLLSSCDFNNILADHDGGTIDVDSIGVANTDGSGYRMLAEGENAHFTPDSKTIIFSNNTGLYSIGVDGSSLTCLYKKKLINNLIVSPDGTRIAFVSDSSQTIYLITVDGSGFRSLYQSNSGKKILYFSDDGTKLYFLENNNFSSVDLNGNSRFLSTSPYFGYGWEPVIIPDGSGVLFFKRSENDSHLILRNLDTQKDSIIVECDYIGVGRKPAKFISQSTFLYIYKDTLYSYNLLKGERQSCIPISNNAKKYSDGIYYYYSQDGKKIAYRTYYNKIEVVNIDGSENTVLTVPESTSDFFPYQISLDNKKVAFISIGRKSVD